MKKTVLIVEHDAQIVKDISDAMPEGQYSVIKAADEQSALRNFQQFQPDIALIDAKSNGMRVMDIYRSFRNQRDIPVIFINGEGTGFIRELYVQEPLDGDNKYPDYVFDDKARMETINKISRPIIFIIIPTTIFILP